MGIPWLRIGLIAVAAIAMATVIYSAYSFVSGLVRDNATLAANNAKLEQAITVQDATIAAQRGANAEWARRVGEMTKQLQEMADADRKAEQGLAAINATLSKHNLGALGKAKPGLVERAVNAGTADALGMLERASAGDFNGAGDDHPSAGGTGPGSGPAPDGPQ